MFAFCYGWQAGNIDSGKKSKVSLIQVQIGRCRKGGKSAHRQLRKTGRELVFWPAERSGQIENEVERLVIHFSSVVTKTSYIKQIHPGKEKKPPNSPSSGSSALMAPPGFLQQ